MKEQDRTYQYKYENIVYALVLIIGLFFCSKALPVENRLTFINYAGSLLLSMSCIYLSEIVENKKISFLLFWIGIAIIGFHMAFRVPDSYDDDDYRRLFNKAENINLWDYFKVSGQEKGYLFLNWILYRWLDGDYNYFQVTITYFTFILWGIGIRNNGKKDGNEMWMVLFLWSHYYFFVINAGLVRIFMALPLVLIGIQYIWKDKWKLFTICVILASLLHMSSLVMLLFLIFHLRQKFFYKNWIAFVFLTLFIVIFSLITMARYLVPVLGERYEGYGNVDSMSLSTGSFTTLPIWLACYYYFKNLPKVTEEYRKKYTIGMILLSLSIIFSIATTMVHVGRIIYYAYLGMLIVIPAIFQLKTRNAEELVLKCLLVIYSLVYVMITNMLNKYQTELFPYETFLNE